VYLGITSFTIRGQDLIRGYVNGEVRDIWVKDWETQSGINPPPYYTPMLSFDDTKPLWVYGFLWPPIGITNVMIDDEVMTIKHLPGPALGGYRPAGNNEEAFYRWGSPALGRDWQMYGEQGLA